MKKIYRNYYKNISSKYNKLRLDGEDEEINKTTEIISDYASKEKGWILDACCGTGRFCTKLDSMGFDVVALDKSIHQLREVPEKFIKIQSSITKTPFIENSFQAVLMVLCIQQLTQYERLKCFKELFRILNKDGYLFIKTCSHTDLKQRGFNCFFPSGLELNLKRYPDIPDLEEELNKNMLKIVQIVPTATIQTINVDDLLNRVKSKHNTTLHLIPEKEFKDGCEKLCEFLGDSIEVEIPHRHTIVIAQKNIMNSKL